MSRKEHWDRVYGQKSDTTVTWYQAHLERSLVLLSEAGGGPESRIIDVGSGSSTLVDDLTRRGFRHVTVLDVSSVALERVRARLGDRAEHVTWLAGDITELELPRSGFDVWHDRAVFHFLTEPGDRARYAAAMRRALMPGGHAIFCTFAEDGPRRCSGLDTMRYSAGALLAELGPGFELVRTVKERHETPKGGEQLFRYCLLRRE